MGLKYAWIRKICLKVIGSKRKFREETLNKMLPIYLDKRVKVSNVNLICNVYPSSALFILDYARGVMT